MPCSAIAALDETTGTATVWNANADGSVVALAVSGTTVYAGGSFSTIGGQARANVAALDATSAVATTWNPSASGIVYAFAVSGNTVYVGGRFSHVGGQLHEGIAAVDATTGAVASWSPELGANAGATIYGVGFSGGALHAGGAFTTVHGQLRPNLAAFEP